MSGFELLKGVRDLDATLDDYRPKKWRGNQNGSGSPQSRTYKNNTTSLYEEPIGCPVEENNIGRCRLDEIAEALRTLTYGEMLELAESMWKINLHGSEITESDLPAVLHRWSTSQRQ
jgi:hypothetical protein